jgi:ADP-heptose:LPS heptosyltransferase
MKILIYNSGGGLGDSIQLFDLISSLSEKYGQNNIFYLSAHKNHFNDALEDYNIKINNLRTEISYFGFRLWHLLSSKRKLLSKNSIEKFDLIIDLQSKLRNTLVLKQIPNIHFYSSTFNFKFCTTHKDYISTKYDNNKILLNVEKLLNDTIVSKKYNTDLIDDKYFIEAKRLLPDSNYIGFSITQGNAYRKKSWPIEKFLGVAKKISKQNKKPVFFIERNNFDLINKITREIKNVLIPELESNLSGPPLVTALSKRLEKAISIDNGIMHMIGLADIPMIVLFGPTNSKKFSPKIKNINILDSKILYNSEEISKIKEQDVLNLI